ncbi:Note [Thraustotheca clavata]|uniref:Note n=1 Tax=Thraustotheca clavata TaxID=74557 RepID=A0A1V9ZIM2_9STRA|nr:Note [Thraustotheca clavata]
MISFPSIDQFRHVIQAINWKSRSIRGIDNKPFYDQSLPLPKLIFSGTVKLHGSNTAIVFDNGNVYFQSRSRVITPTDDYFGFASTMTKYSSCTEILCGAIKSTFDVAEDQVVAVYGEWCGDKIQKGVALAQLPKMFVYFAIRVGEVWVDISRLKSVEFEQERIFNIHRFGEYEIEINFERPQDIQEHINELTLQVEAECPAGKYFGVSDVGEGIVWKCISEGYNNNSEFWFKTKGTAFMLNSTPKEPASIQVFDAASVTAFVDEFVSENRLQQGLQVLVERSNRIEMQQMRDFIKWVQQDIAKEENDALVANNLNLKHVNHAIADKARKWFTDTIKNQA